MKIQQYWHTIRHLKPIQVSNRIWRNSYNPTLYKDNLPRRREGAFLRIQGPGKARSMLNPRHFVFLNEEKTLNSLHDWNNTEWDKLWIYNLHYFDDLHAEGAATRRHWHRQLVDRWIEENPPGVGSGWEPYPTSIRIVNWIKWFLTVREFEIAWLNNLAIQVRYLYRRLEYHLLGNHLFANLKALIFSGCFFQGPEADKWLRKGIVGLKKELDEQILSDGGHFERSPMYHSIILEDVLDLINITDSCRSSVPDRFLAVTESLRETARRMLGWLSQMVHADGGIVLFNDAAFGIAPSLEKLSAYSEALSLPVPSLSFAPLKHLKETGYIRVEMPFFTAFLDTALVGPDHLPGHAHADTLTFELSCGDRRLIVDSGTSCYGDSVERLRQRSTSAHNTVEIDGENSSEIWGGFRVAKRAYPLALEIEEKKQEIMVRCCHDGYRRLAGKPVHIRTWRFGKKSFVVSDTVSGNFSRAVSRFHFHPDVQIQATGRSEGRIDIAGGKQLLWVVEGGPVSLKPSTYHPEFGVSIANQCLEVLLDGKSCEIKFRLI